MCNHKIYKGFFVEEVMNNKRPIRKVVISQIKAELHHLTALALRVGVVNGNLGPHVRGYHFLVSECGQRRGGLEFDKPEEPGREHGDDTIGILLVGNYRHGLAGTGLYDALAGSMAVVGEVFGVGPENVVSRGELLGIKDYMPGVDMNRVRGMSGAPWRHM